MDQKIRTWKLLNRLRFFVDFFYPPYCTICHSMLQKDERIVCENCWGKIPTVDDSYDIVAEIQSKLKDQVYFSHAYSVWLFVGPIQQVIHLLKYQNYRIVTERMGEYMADKIRSISSPVEKMLLIPVPLHKTRTRERGYNQSLLLCKSISSQLGIHFLDNILIRNRYTQSQTRLNAFNRQKNVADAFHVISKENIKDKIIILVDDVITTGATMNACAKALAQNGASEIYLFSAVKA